ETSIRRINAITGADFETEQIASVVKFEDVEQIIPIPVREGKDQTAVYALVNSLNQIHIYPETYDARVAFEIFLPKFYYYVLKKGETSVNGFTVAKDAEKNSYVATSLWSLDLPAGEIIADYAEKDKTEPISLIGRVLGNRSVLYKYLNSNLLALVTLRETPNTSHVYLYLIDTVTGTIFHRSVYSGAGNAAAGLDSIFVTQVDNSVILSYYNHGPAATEILTEPEIEDAVPTEATAGGKKVGKRRGKANSSAPPNVKGYEITVLEIYEMPKPDLRIESNTYSSYSSFRPSILSQSYIFPNQITAIGKTVTGAGIASREILFGLSTNQLYGVNKRMLDPRRVYGTPTAEDKEEQLFPYRPVLDFNPKEVASHVIEVVGIKKVISTPSSLESTSIVAAYGLDLFVARRSPSKTFDLLSEDFGYVSLILTLITLVIGIQIAKYYAEKKRVADQWK
ncbi:hypothetical protein HK100_007225, partial [Physocladia obscura]